MAISAGKVVPSVIVLAFVGYCAWPSVSELTSDPPPTPPVKVPELATTLFSPTLPSRPTKNPWGGLDAESLAAAKKAAAEAAKAAAAKKAAEEAAKAAEEAARAAEKAAGAMAGSATAKKPDDPLNSLKLEATCILGDQRLAMINGQLYAPQDRLSTGNASLPPFMIVSVFPNKVLMECKGKTAELTYDSAVSRPAPPPEAKSPEVASPVTSAKVTSAKVGSPKTDLFGITSVTGWVTSFFKKHSTAATALPSGATNKSSKAGN